jgi:hypothetical protein
MASFNRSGIRQMQHSSGSKQRQAQVTGATGCRKVAKENKHATNPAESRSLRAKNQLESSPGAKWTR